MIKYYPEMPQGSDEWLAARCGLLTASEMKLIMTPARLQFAGNDKCRAHLYTLLAQRITGFVEPHFVSSDMLRGRDDEVEARILYAKHYGEVHDMGFITNDRWGFKLGFSPDGLVGDEGFIECKSRRSGFQIETILNFGSVPDEYILQIQTGLLVSGRKWCDFVSYSGGLPMMTLRVEPDEFLQEKIVAAADAFHRKLTKKWEQYTDALARGRFIPTERRVEVEILV